MYPRLQPFPVQTLSDRLGGTWKRWRGPRILGNLHGAYIGKRRANWNSHLSCSLCQCASFGLTTWKETGEVRVSYQTISLSETQPLLVREVGWKLQDPNAMPSSCNVRSFSGVTTPNSNEVIGSERYKVLDAASPKSPYGSTASLLKSIPGGEARGCKP